MNERLRDIEWGTVILDECHLIKNRKAQRTQAVMKVTPPYAYRIGLTATPFGNDPSDIWAQLRWMAPKLPGLRSYWKFHATFCERESGYNIVTGARYKKVAGGRNLKQLATLMKGFGLRHSKREVASQLPPITDTRIPLEMNGKQAVLYDQLRKKSCYELVVPADDGGPEVRINVANALSRLIRMEQLLSHPWKFLDGVNGAKLEWLLDWAAGYSEQAVIAVRFKETASHVARSLGEACGQPITGDVSTEERHLIIEDWKNNSHQFMVGTIGTIGIGLSFENARAMVLYDQLWSTIKMEQARQRIHRVTSKFPVQILYPCIVDTSNEIILEAFTSHWEQMEVVRAFIQHLQQQEEGQ